MGRLKIPLIIFLGIISFFACEKDDICVAGDTPRMVIQFFDILDPTESKDVQNLVVKGLDELGERADSIPNIALDSIVLPLRPTETSTSFTMKRTLSITDVAIDTIIFNYSTEEIFLSRACGFIVNYDNIEATLSEQNPDSLWIKRISVENALIKNSAVTHVKIFH